MSKDRLLAELGEQSGDIALQCSDTAGFLGRFNRMVQSERQRLSILESNMARLGQNHDASNVATDELRSTAEAAQHILSRGNDAAAHSLDELAALLSGIGALEGRLTEFLSRIEAVDGISRTLERLSKQSQILGLNASIEAARGGVDARGFGVVAAEMRRLSAEAGQASKRVSSELGEIDGAARALIGAVGGHISAGQQASGHIDSIKSVLTEMASLVIQFQDRSAAISGCIDRAGSEVRSLATGLSDFSELARTSGAHADEARQRLDNLESRANDMLNKVAHGGIRTRDTAFVAMALAGAGEARSIVEGGLDKGEITVAALFDIDYRAIDGTGPSQFVNGFVDFADRRLQPMLDRRTAEDPAIVGCVVVDRNGFLPTHISARSQPQRQGETQWNLENSRNRQIFMDGQTRRALDGTDDYYLYTYRQDFGDGQFRALRSVLVPIDFRGRRWGLYELGYLI